MGVVPGRFDISRSAETIGDVQGDIQTKMNSGIAMVTPAAAVTNLLMREDVVDHRQERVTNFTRIESNNNLVPSPIIYSKVARPVPTYI